MDLGLAVILPTVITGAISCSRHRRRGDVATRVTGSASSTRRLARGRGHPCVRRGHPPAIENRAIPPPLAGMPPAQPSPMLHDASLSIMPPRRRATKIACRIDADLLRRVEAVRATTGESRSALISRALLALTASSVRARSVERYVAAYRECPERPADVATARRSARRALAGVAWEDG